MMALPEGVRGDKRRKEDQLRLMNEIRKLIPLKKDREIMRILGMPNSTFYRYKSKIYKENKELWCEAMFEPLESRLLKLYECLQESSRISKDIAFDDSNKPMERIRASRKMINDQYNTLQLLKEGPNWKYCEYF